MITNSDDIRDLIMKASEGEITDAERVDLYRVALTVAANEFYRIESIAEGSVNPAVLTLLQQIELIAGEGATPERMYEEAIKHAEGSGGGDSITLIE